MAPRKLISEEELAKHDSQNNCWFAMHGLVMKMDKKLADEHPGGIDIIMALAGKDATDDFEEAGHSDKARNWANELIIGYTDEEKKDALMPTSDEVGNQWSEENEEQGFEVAVTCAVLFFLCLIMYYFRAPQGKHDSL